jgi:uncharacterized RDD family membrane protein YckC
VQKRENVKLQRRQNPARSAGPDFFRGRQHAGHPRESIARLRNLAMVLAAILLFVLPAHFALASAPTTQATQPATQPANARRNLLAHANKDFFWVARITPPEGSADTDHTRIDYRSAGSSAWESLTDIPARAIGLADLGGRVAVLIESGEWLLFGEEGSGSVSGEPLPRNAKIVAIATESDVLWAIGITPAPTTQPAGTQPTTLPASASPQPPLSLFMRKGDKWMPAAGPAIPADISPDLPLSLAIIEQTPYLAVQRADHHIDVLRQTPAGWQETGRSPAPAQSGAFKLLCNLNPPILWVAGETADELRTLPLDKQGKVVPLKPTNAPISDRTAVYAVNAIREISIVNGKLVDQEYNPQTFAPNTSATVSLPAPATSPITTPLFQLGIFVALVFAIFSSTRRRRQLLEATPHLENVELADLARRLAAGLIDAFPFAAPIIVGFQSVQMHESTADPSFSGTPVFFAVFAAAWFVYLIHTAASEALAGKTLGKWVLGLRVVRLDGGTPDPVALLIRNFLRLVDIGLMCVPLVFIAFSPLRQRIGDVAAGTIVIRDRVKPEGNLVKPEAEKSETTAASPSDEKPPAPAD